MDYDTWLQEPYQQDDSPAGEHEFITKLRGGTVKVYGTVEGETEVDEDGKYTCWTHTIDSCHWTFSEEAEVDLTEEEKEELEGKLAEIAEDF